MQNTQQFTNQDFDIEAYEERILGILEDLETCLSSIQITSPELYKKVVAKYPELGYNIENNPTNKTYVVLPETRDNVVDLNLG